MKIFFILTTYLISIFAFAEYNVKCPAPKICETISNNLELCERGVKKECSDFIKNYKLALPKYDCQPKDAKPTDTYVMSAIATCDNHEYLLNSLSKMNSLQAKKLYGSSELRAILDGDLAEQHLKKSKSVEKSLKNSH